MFNCKPHGQNCNFRNSCYKNREFFPAGNEAESSFGKNILSQILRTKSQFPKLLSQESGILFLKNKDSFWQAKKQKFLLKRIFNCRSYEKSRNFRIHQKRGRTSYDQNFIKLTFTAGNFENYGPNYLMKSDKTLLQYSSGVVT